MCGTKPGIFEPLGRKLAMFSFEIVPSKDTEF